MSDVYRIEASAVYSVILATLVNNKKINRTVGIILGAAAIVLGSVLPGVLYIVDSYEKFVLYLEFLKL